MELQIHQAEIDFNAIGMVNVKALFVVGDRSDIMIELFDQQGCHLRLTLCSDDARDLARKLADLLPPEDDEEKEGIS